MLAVHVIQKRHDFLLVLRVCLPLTWRVLIPSVQIQLGSITSSAQVEIILFLIPISPYAEDRGRIERLSQQIRRNRFDLWDPMAT